MVGAGGLVAIHKHMNRGFQTTTLLRLWRRGSATARELLFSRLHGRLRRLVRRNARIAGPSLETDEVMSELFERIARRSVQFRNGDHFMAVASMMIRNVAVDDLRRRHRLKRGGEAPLEWSTQPARRSRAPELAVDLERSLRELRKHDERLAQVLELRVIGGLTVPEVSETLGIATSTVERDWRAARAWLMERLG